MRLLLITAMAMLAALGPVQAQTSKQGDLTFVRAYAFASIGAARAGAVFVTIRNAGADDALIGVGFEGSARAELHTHKHENGTMKMRPVAQITVPAGGEVKLQPGGDHIMLMGLKSGLKAGNPHELVLIFRDAGRVPVAFAVEERN